MKDKFIKLKNQLSEKLSKFEAFLALKKQYEERGKAKDIYEKKKVEEKLEDLYKEIQKDKDALETELKAQGKKDNVYDLDQKKKICQLLKEKIGILEKKYKGEDYEEELNNYDQNIIQLDDFLKKSKVDENSELRELFEEEKNKIDEWKGRVKKQDEKLEEIRWALRQIKGEAEKAGDAIKGIGVRVKKTDIIMTNTTKKLKTQNERVKELVNKIRSSDKICVDITLILILFGLICVLYSIIKHKY